MLHPTARFLSACVGVGLAGVAACGVGACGGQQQRAADMSFTPEVEPEERASPDTLEDEAFNAPTPAEGATASSASRLLLGVRPDLALAAAGPGAGRCPCLAVEIGSPSDAKFVWQAGAPASGPGAIAIAVSSRGVECPGGDPDESKRRPSISAVDVEGNDVVVEIEELPDGPPLASGALIPEPGPGGSVYVRGRTKSVPYGRSASSARCKVR